MVRHSYKYNNWPVGEGWYPLIEELITKIAVLAEDFDVNILDIKEKIGCLRIWIDKPTKEMIDLITEYEKKSYTICEVCGNTGKYRNDLPWKLTLCEKHYQDEVKQQYNF